MNCEKCIFYNKMFWEIEPRCEKIKSWNVKSKRLVPVPLSFGQKVCKGYFFEYDLYSTKDSSLSNEKNPFETLVDGDVR